MNKRSLNSLSALLMVSVVLSPISAVADPDNHGHGKYSSRSDDDQGQDSRYSRHKYHDEKPHHDQSRHRKHVHDEGTGGASLTITLTYDDARTIALRNGMRGYAALPPGIAKNLARGKPLPPGIAKKRLPAPALMQLPVYPGYEWTIAGKDLVLIAVSTAVVTAIINNVFD